MPKGKKTTAKKTPPKPPSHSKLLRNAVEGLEGKSWANVEMGKLPIKPRSVTRRNKPKPSSKKEPPIGKPIEFTTANRIKLTTANRRARNVENLKKFGVPNETLNIYKEEPDAAALKEEDEQYHINHQKYLKQRAAEKEARKDPMVKQKRYIAFLTCLLIQFNIIENPSNAHTPILKKQNCESTLDNAGNFKDNGIFTKNSMLKGFKMLFSDKKYKEFKTILDNNNAENTLNTDLEDLLLELNRVEGMIN